MVRRSLVPLAALAIAATGCGGGGSDAVSAEFCEAWLDAVAEESYETTEDEIAGGLAHLQALVDTAPASLVDEVSAIHRSMTEAGEVLARFGYDFDRLDSEGTRADVRAIEDTIDAILDLGAESETARAAFEGCEGAPDPTFEMGCVSSKFTAISPALGAGPTVYESPDEIADKRVASYEDVDRWERRELEGGDGYEYALLSPTGRTLGLIEVAESDGSWSSTRSSTCEGTG